MISSKSGTTRGVLKFFNTMKGFGFVDTKEGDIFLHATKAERFIGHLVPGAVVTIAYKTGQRGLETSEVVSVSEPPVYEGEIKFYDTDRNFGFISCPDLDDVFLPRSVALAAGVVPWPGLQVEFQCVPSSKRSMQATMIRPVEEVALAPDATETVAENIPQPAKKMPAKKNAGKKSTKSRASKLNGSAVHAASV